MQKLDPMKLLLLRTQLEAALQDLHQQLHQGRSTASALGRRIIRHEPVMEIRLKGMTVERLMQNNRPVTSVLHPDARSLCPPNEMGRVTAYLLAVQDVDHPQLLDGGVTKLR